MFVKTKGRRRLAMLATAAIASIASVPARANQAMDVYANSIYGYCDAKKVAAVWNNSIFEAKAVIGNKIMQNIQHLVDQDIASARWVGCSWDETELTYEDALKLAEFWDRSPSSAKQKAAAMASEMGVKRMMEQLWTVLRR